MSRLVDAPIVVEADDSGTPALVEGLSVLCVVDHYRIWVGVLRGEPQVDVWKVETAQGICELRYLSHPTGNETAATQGVPGSWLLSRWED